MNIIKKTLNTVNRQLNNLLGTGTTPKKRKTAKRKTAKRRR